MEVDRHPHGMPSWADLASPDLDAAKAFYAGLFGWEIETDPRPEAGGYSMCTLRGLPVAAMMPHDPSMGPAGWGVYLTVDDADAAAAKVREAGGQVVADPFDVFDVGRMARITDTEGATLSIWQAKAHIGTRVVDEPGTIAWIQLDDITDQQRAATFYANVFGWEHDDDPYMSCTVAGKRVAGLTEPSGEHPAAWLTYFGVAERDAAVARIEELGGRVAHVVDGPRFAIGLDPTGVPFSVLEPWQ